MNLDSIIAILSVPYLLFFNRVLLVVYLVDIVTDKSIDNAISLNQDLACRLYMGQNNSFLLILHTNT